MIKRICNVCNKPFYVYPSDIKYCGAKYCSNLCKNIGHKGLHRGKEIKKGQHLSSLTEFKKGEPSLNNKGGYQSPVGYLWIWKPEHHRANKSGYVLNCILVVEDKTKRELLSSEVVHHKNEIKSDDRIENLQVMTREEHKSYHAKKRWDNNTFR